MKYSQKYIDGKKLRPYQLESLNKFCEKYDQTNGNFNGQINCCTGTGKSLIYASFMEEILQGEENKIIHFACHRGMLATDSFQTIFKVFTELNKKLTIYINNSFGEKITTIKGEDVTDEEEISRFLDQDKLKENLENFLGICKDSKRCKIVNDYSRDALPKALKRDLAESNVLVISLYQSFDKINLFDGVIFDLAIYDEAHNISSENKTPDAMKWMKKSKINIFLTATPTNDDHPYSMANHGVFGDVLMALTPRQAIKGKYITPFLPIVSDFKKNGENVNVKLERILEKTPIQDKTNSGKLFEESLIYDSKKAYEEFYNRSGNKYHGIMMVSVPGSYYLKRIKELDSNFVNYIVEKNIDTYITFSEPTCGGCFRFNHVNKVWDKFDSYTKFLSYLGNIDDSQERMILQIDQLTQGIDLPNINILLPYRLYSWDMQSICQFMGRGQRRHPDDIGMIDDKTVSAGDFEKFHKPYCLLMIPSACYSFDDANQYLRVIKSITDEYNLNFYTGDNQIYDARGVKYPVNNIELPQDKGEYVQQFLWKKEHYDKHYQTYYYTLEIDEKSFLNYMQIENAKKSNISKECTEIGGELLKESDDRKTMFKKICSYLFEKYKINFFSFK